MKKESKSKADERRKHNRITIMTGLLEPIEIKFQDPDKKGNTPSQPAIISNLSAGGMSLMTFMQPPKMNILEICLNVPSLEKIPIKGRVSWVREKAGVYMTGIAFVDISKASEGKINAMAEDFQDCETRLSLHLPEACVENCKCHYLCNKPQKDESLFQAKENKTSK
ncbi:MAG TPA: PilZ domain-containing protein [Elusimicrobiales bacterium]|nr:PilZ domain-containing protein [Elusimicrobiales bacterium]